MKTFCKQRNKQKFLLQLSVQDYSTYGINSADDKRKFVALAQALKKEGIKKPSNDKSPLTRKRSSSTARLSTMTPPEKQARRLTLGGDKLARSPLKTPPSRRLSYIPPKSASPRKTFSPPRNLTRSTAHLNQNIKSVSFSPLKEKLINNDLDTDDDIPTTVAAPKLDTYGIPASHSRASQKSENPSSKSQLSAATNGLSDLNQRIRVCVRKRPLSRREIATGEKDIAPVSGARSINVNAPK
jgi:hypothetical protein